MSVSYGVIGGNEAARTDTPFADHRISDRWPFAWMNWLTR